MANREHLYGFVRNGIVPVLAVVGLIMIGIWAVQFGVEAVRYLAPNFDRVRLPHQPVLPDRPPGTVLPDVFRLERRVEDLKPGEKVWIPAESVVVTHGGWNVNIKGGSPIHSLRKGRILSGLSTPESTDYALVLEKTLSGGLTLYIPSNLRFHWKRDFNDPFTPRLIPVEELVVRTGDEIGDL